MKKKFAFTMAEVIIVISLLGVIAALTIPNLYYSKTKHEYATRIKRFYSKMDNAIAQMELEKGSFKDMHRPDDGEDTGNGSEANNRLAYLWYMENIDPYMEHKFIKNPDSNTPKIYFSDGSSLYITRGGCLDLHYDVNGDKGSGKAGREQFTFLICFSDYDRNYFFGDGNIFFGTYGGKYTVTDDDGNETQKDIVNSDTSREVLIDACKNSVSRCSRLLQRDNWEFKEDYPRF
ncbi:type II secretion system protein [bacterium]|nr:type II secretion system protein [bacterium]